MKKKSRDKYRYCDYIERALDICFKKDINRNQTKRKIVTNINIEIWYI